MRDATISAVVAIHYLIVFVLTMGNPREDAGLAGQYATSTREINVPNETATFAAGCFWGVQSTFERLPGVLMTRVGYTGGKTVDPTYEDVCAGDTNHAEAIEITFDPSKVTYRELLNIFFESHDPTTLDRQGPDVGTQYRSAVFYHSPQQKELAEAEMEKRQASGEYARPLVTQVAPAKTFYSAEEYHQLYFYKNGIDYSCHTGNGKKPAFRRK